jgi:hypothetical protein
MSDNDKMALFEENDAVIDRVDQAAVARATQEIQAALVIAKRFPRDEIRVKAKILAACNRKELAEVAEYEYSRGGTRFTGPTIDLLRAIANRWGNLRFGWTEIDRQEGQSSVRCFSWDMETNGQAERTFTVKHWRDTQGGGYAVTDSRDIYELLANAASRRVRATLEEVIDSDIVTAAIEQCRETLRTGEKTPLADRAVVMVSAFAEFGVTQDDIERRLGNKLDGVSENQLASLRRVFKSLKDGVGKKEDYFKPEMGKPDFGKEATPKASKTAKPTPTAAAAAPEPSKPAAEAPQSVQEPSDADDGDLGPAEPTTTPAPATAPVQPTGFNALKALRNLCKMANIGEGSLLDFLSSTGATDGSSDSLESFVLADSKLAKMVADDWANVSRKINEQSKRLAR